MPTPDHSAHAARRIALALLATCFLLNLLARGVADAYAVFLLPLVGAFGWQRTEVSSVYALYYVVVGTSGPLIGLLFDRWGHSALTVIGLVCLALAYAAVSRAEALWQFYLATGLLQGIGAACLGVVPMAALLSRWFRPRLNTALAVGYASGGVGLMLAAPVAQALIDAQGWRGAYLALAGLFLLALPLAAVGWLTRAGAGHPAYRLERPAGGGAADGITLRQALRGSPFWSLIYTYLATGIGMYTVVLQIPAYLVEIGFDAAAAARALGAVGVLAPVGMVGFGWLGDRIGRRRSILLSYALTVAGILTLLALAWYPQWPLVILFIALFGGSFGSRGPAISAISASIFRGPALGRIYGCITVGMGFGGGLGAYSGGLWHDLTGNYLGAFAFAAAMVGSGALPFLLVRRMARV